MNDYMDWIVPGWKDFVNQEKPEVEQPVRTEGDYTIFDEEQE